MPIIDRWRKARPEEPKVIEPEELGDWYDDDEDDPFSDEWDEPSFYPDDDGSEKDDDDDYELGTARRDRLQAYLREDKA